MVVIGGYVLSRGVVWLIAGLAIGAAETIVPGAFLVWVGLAAIVVGLVDLVAAPGLFAEMLVFAVATLISVAIGRRVYGSLERKTPDLPLSRAHALLGRQFVLDKAIANGFGTMRVEDSVWRVAGPELPAGSRVRVAEVVDGGLVRVEQA